MSWPSSRMRPAEGRSTPVSRLITVVLPAPFGPIKAWWAPFSIMSETPLTAAMPPKCFSTPVVSSAIGICSTSLAGRSREASGGRRRAGDRPFGQRARKAGPQPDALAADEHNGDQHQTNPELPILRGQIGNPILHQLENHGPDQP